MGLGAEGRGLGHYFGVNPVGYGVTHPRWRSLNFCRLRQPVEGEQTIMGTPLFWGGSHLG